jgi:hypothetical protein
LLELELGSSTASCSDGSSVSWPIRRAIAWSIVGLPTVASEPAVFRGLMPVRYAAATQWSEPVVPSGGSADFDHRPLTTVVWSLTLPSPSSTYGSFCGSEPSAPGSQ